MGAGRKAPVIAVEILDHLGAFKRQPTRADTAGENGHRCQKCSKRRLHIRAAGVRGQVAARPPISSDRISAPRSQERVNKLAWLGTLVRLLDCYLKAEDRTASTHVGHGRRGFKHGGIRCRGRVSKGAASPDRSHESGHTRPGCITAGERYGSRATSSDRRYERGYARRCRFAAGCAEPEPRRSHRCATGGRRSPARIRAFGLSPKRS
jgi:hypothetical protein